MAHTRNDGHTPRLQVPIQPNIGLESDARQAIVEILNITLADEVVLQTQSRCAMWNIRGADFYQLHALLKDHCQLIDRLSDDIGGRVRMLGGFTIGSLEDYLQHTRLEEQPGLVPDILRLLANHEALIRFLRVDIRKCTEEYEDEGSYGLLVQVICQHEKMAWMLRSCIEVETNESENLKS